MFEFLTIRDVAELRDVADITVRRDIAAGRLAPDARTRAGVWLFRPETALQYVNARRARRG